MMNDGLLGWKRAGGRAGAELVPDTAVSLPSISDDRRTYIFSSGAASATRTGDSSRPTISATRSSASSASAGAWAVAVDFYRDVVGRIGARPVISCSSPVGS